MLLGGGYSGKRSSKQKYKRNFYRKLFKEKAVQDKTWPRKVKFSFQNKIISGTNSGRKISLPCALSSGNLVTWVRCRKRTCNAQPICSSSDYCQAAWSIPVPQIRCCQKPQSSHWMACWRGRTSFPHSIQG